MASAVPEAADAATLRRARAVATILDESIRIPGTSYRIGVDPILSAIPGPWGDLAGGALSMYIVLEAANMGVPYTTVVRMLANVGVDTGVGLVPFVGALFDATYRANRRNVALMERHLRHRSGTPADHPSTDAQPGTIGAQ